jgi:hypothetical protein
MRHRVPPHFNRTLTYQMTTITTGLQETGLGCGPDLSGWQCVLLRIRCWTFGLWRRQLLNGRWKWRFSNSTALHTGGYAVSIWLNIAKCHSRVECTTVTALCCQVKGDHNCVKETTQLSRGRSQTALLNSIYFSISTWRWWSSVQNISRTRGNAICIMFSVFNEQDQRTVMGMS